MSLARLARLVLASWFGLLVPLGLVVATAAPAAACSCVSAEVRGMVQRADTVFTGVLEGADVDGTEATYTFAVGGVLRGEPGQPAVVGSSASGASCGLEDMRVGERYVVLAADGRANLCGGTAPATPAYVAEIEAVTGPGRAPVEEASGPPSGDRAEGALRTAAVAGAVAAVVVAVVVVTRRARTGSE